MSATAGKVYLVGAGPGDPGLLTERAARVLAGADLVLYDALVPAAVLDRVRPGAVREYVGKRRRGSNEDGDARQARIHARMIAAASAGQSVVRLKGGDPFLFGRGSEEASALVDAGIEFEIVPGVPAPTAVAAYAGISLTHRDLSSSVAFVTGTERFDRESTAHDWSKLATAAQTLCVFMGVERLAEIVERLVAHGRAEGTPIAVIANGTRPDQQVIVGTLVNIVERVERDYPEGAPGLVVVGEVVRLRARLRWFDNRPLFGKRVLVTRAREQAGTFSQRLRDEGAEPIERATIRLAAPEEPEPLERAAREAASYDVVVFTSQNGVSAFFDALDRAGGDARRLGRALVAAIGPATASSLRERGVRADVVPSEYVGEALVEALRAHGDLAGKRMLLPRAAVARDVVPDALRAAGATVDVVEAYRSLPPDEAGTTALRDLLEKHAIDVVTFTASSTARNLVEALGPDAARLLAPVQVASIGPVTTATARELGLRVDVTATAFTMDGLIDAMREHFASAAAAR